MCTHTPYICVCVCRALLLPNRILLWRPRLVRVFVLETERGLATAEVTHRISGANTPSPVVGCKIPWKENSLISRAIGDFFSYPDARSPFFGSTRQKVSINPFVFLSGAPVLINRRVNLGLTRGNRDGGGAKKIENSAISASFFFEVSCSQRCLFAVAIMGVALHSASSLRLYTILPSPMLYGVWHTKEGGRWGGRILRNGGAIVLQ